MYDYAQRSMYLEAGALSRDRPGVCAIFHGRISHISHISHGRIPDPSSSRSQGLTSPISGVHVHIHISHLARQRSDSESKNDPEA